MGDENKPQTEQLAQWLQGLDERTQKHIAFAVTYARQYAHGAPGHLDLMTIAALADLLTTQEKRGSSNLTAALSPTSSINDAMSAIEDIAELTGWPCIDSDRADDNFVMTFKWGA